MFLVYGNVYGILNQYSWSPRVACKHCILVKMAAAQRHFRKYWKRYVFGNLALALGGSYFTKKLRDKNITRVYCSEAKTFGDQMSTTLERPKKVIVFLNPKANNVDAKSQFMKFSAPLFHLSGTEVTIVESDYEGQIRTLLGYIDPSTEAIVVAGGDGTLMEVINGVMRRYDSHKTKNIPIGVIPLGKENRFYTAMFGSQSGSPARRIGEATMDVIRGHTAPVHLMEIQPEKGKPLYSLSSVQWGAFNDAMENKDSFWLLGKLRVLASHISTALKRWPVDHTLNVWIPTRNLSAESAQGGSSSTHRISEPTTESCDSSSRHGNMSSVRHGFGLLPVARCVEREGVGQSSLLSRVGGLPSWSVRKYQVIGFKLNLMQSASSVDECLKLTLWPSALSKGSFIKHGWSETINTQSSSIQQLPTHQLKSSELVLHPVFPRAGWLFVDGEIYETMTLSVRVLPNSLNLFTRTTSGK